MALKRTFNRLPKRLRPAMVELYAGAFLVWLTLHGKNPVAYVRNYRRDSRGMSYVRNVEDWLGGLPIEFARPEEVKEFAENRGFVVELVWVGPPGGKRGISASPATHFLMEPASDRLSSRA